MGHAPLVRGEINLAQAGARPRCRNYSQMDSGPDLRKKQMLQVKPHQSRGVLQQKMRLASQS